VHMTERQRQIKERLDRGMSVREIAEDMGVTRNAVYQQIQRMRRAGDLPAYYTQTGQPAREGFPSRVTSQPNGGESAESLDFARFLQALQLKDQRANRLGAELQAISRRLEEIAAQLA